MRVEKNSNQNRLKAHKVLDASSGKFAYAQYASVITLNCLMTFLILLSWYSFLHHGLVCMIMFLMKHHLFPNPGSLFNINISEGKFAASIIRNICNVLLVSLLYRGIQLGLFLYVSRISVDSIRLVQEGTWTSPVLFK